MPTIHDDEFGTISVLRSAKSRQARIRVAPNGTLRATLPPYTPLLFLKKMIHDSRLELRTMLARTLPPPIYYDGQPIGKRHTLLIRHGQPEAVARKGNTIIATVTDTQHLTQAPLASLLRQMMIKALRIEAKEYLPKRLAQLATAMDCHYQKVRFSHASTRWGSCSSTGTISLNIALMKLPMPLIDYVLIHELAHTREMNHSSAFWQIVGQFDPEYLQHKQQLRTQTPSI